MAKVAVLIDFARGNPQLARVSVGEERDSEGRQLVQMCLLDHVSFLEAFRVHIGKQLQWNSMWKQINRAGLKMEVLEEGKKCDTRVFSGWVEWEVLTRVRPAKRRKVAAERVPDKPVSQHEALLAALSGLREGVEGDMDWRGLAAPMWRVVPPVVLPVIAPLSIPAATVQQGSLLRMPSGKREERDVPRQGPVVEVGGVAYRVEPMLHLVPVDGKGAALVVPDTDAPLLRNAQRFEQLARSI